MSISKAKIYSGDQYQVLEKEMPDNCLGLCFWCSADGDCDQQDRAEQITKGLKS